MKQHFTLSQIAVARASSAVMALTTFFASSCSANDPPRAGERPVVVVELFTSEGCSSCPPADVLLGKLARPDAVAGVDIVPLEMHVDYWNRLGWTDPFSSAAFSRRQSAYARQFGSDEVYTPQMVVDGAAGFVGSDRAKAAEAISAAANSAKGVVSLELAPISANGQTAECKISIVGLPAGSGGVVMLAVTEDGLSSAVSRGENAGQTLPHASVVRSLLEVGTIKPDHASPYSTTATVHLDAAWKIDRLRVTVFVQDPASMKVIAAGKGAIIPAGRK